jgi:hypothetical protein
VQAQNFTMELHGTWDLSTIICTLDMGGFV